MPSTRQKFSIGYFFLASLGLLLLHAVFLAPQSENLSYRDFKTLLKAGKVIDLLLWERTITGRLATDGLEGLLPPPKIEELRKSGRGEPHFMTVQVDDPTLIADLQAAGVQFQGRIESRWLGTLLSWIVPALVFVAIWGFLMRRMGTASGLMTIGKSKAKVVVPHFHRDYAPRRPPPARLGSLRLALASHYYRACFTMCVVSPADSCRA